MSEGMIGSHFGNGSLMQKSSVAKEVGRGRYDGGEEERYGTMAAFGLLGLVASDVGMKNTCAHQRIIQCHLARSIVIELQ